MKKILTLVLSLALVVCAFTLTGCSKTESKRVVIYTAAEDERIAYLQEELNKKFSNLEIVIQSIGTGQLLSKLQAEGKNTECDIFYDLEVINAEIIINESPDLFADLSEYDFSIYDSSVTGYTSRHKQYAVNGKTYGAFLVNTKMLADQGISVPSTYADLLDTKYKGLIAMPSPKSSGTGYSMYNGMITVLGEDEGLKYFDSLNGNIKEYTTSGSAPVKSVVRGDVAIGFGLLWQCVQYANADEGIVVIVPDNKLPFGLFSMGMITGHETNKNVKSVFTYLYNELNEKQVTKYNPDKIYVDQLHTEIENYTTGFEEISMSNLFDFAYKQDILDKWKY